MWEYKAQITRVVDGDTFDAIVDLGFGIFHHIRVRLSGIDTPETYRPKSEAEKKHGLEVSAWAKQMLEKREVTIKTSKTRASIYGRWEATIVLPDGRDLTKLMKYMGFEKKENY